MQQNSDITKKEAFSVLIISVVTKYFKEKYNFRFIFCLLIYNNFAQV